MRIVVALKDQRAINSPPSHSHCLSVFETASSPSFPFHGLAHPSPTPIVRLDKCFNLPWCMIELSEDALVDAPRF